MIHEQKTIYGSWVTSPSLMEELVERLVRWNLHPADIIIHRFALEDAANAYALWLPASVARLLFAITSQLRCP